MLNDIVKQRDQNVSQAQELISRQIELVEETSRNTDDAHVKEKLRNVILGLRDSVDILNHDIIDSSSQYDSENGTTQSVIISDEVKREIDEQFKIMKGRFDLFRSYVGSL